MPTYEWLFVGTAQAQVVAGDFERGSTVPKGIATSVKAPCSSLILPNCGDIARVLSRPVCEITDGGACAGLSRRNLRR